MKKSKQQNSTLLTKEEALAQRKWLLFDASGKTLGRFATEIAKILRGKHKPTFTPHVDCGDGVIIINAEKIEVTGAKEAQKIYRHYTGAMGGLRETPFRVMKARKPDFIIRQAVKGMMPNSRLGKQQMKKLRIFAGSEHDLQAQQPIPVTV
ncbi:MAG: 50S ribosomal protein L13 [Chlamydiae bacterium]|nr:50S ribosomal protein L13 [Chlamydiota bacterium]